MKKFNVIFLLLSIIFIPFKINEVNANSALKIYSEYDNNGVYIKNDNNSIEVINEDLTFNISSFDYNVDNFVSAKYTFKNKSENNVNATLVFPFGDVPSSYKENLNNLYDITINDNVINKNIRYTYNYNYENYYDFKLDIDLNKLQDNYIELDNLTKDTIVHNYKIKTNVNDLYSSCYLKLNTYEYQNNYFVTKDYSGYSDADKKIYFSNNVINIYIIGEGINNLSNRFIHINKENRVEVRDEVEILEYNTSSFKELVDSYYYESMGVSQIDHYNAIVNKMIENNHFILDKDAFYVYDNLLCWYEYELNFKPNEEIINEVKAPLFPTIYDDYRPVKYGYKYLLTPASTFNDFHNLNIRINTPYIMQYSSIKDFIQDENGYSLSLEKLPEQDLYFELSTKSISNKKINTGYLLLYFAIFGLPILGIILILTIIYFIVRYYKRKKLKNI